MPRVLLEFLREIGALVSGEESPLSGLEDLKVRVKSLAQIEDLVKEAQTELLDIVSGRLVRLVANDGWKDREGKPLDRTGWIVGLRAQWVVVRVEGRYDGWPAVIVYSGRGPVEAGDFWGFPIHMLTVADFS